FFNNKNCIHFIFRLNNILFMWLILYFLILFISYCSVHKKEHDVDHWGKFYLKRAFIVFWNINCELQIFNFIIFNCSVSFFQLLEIPNLGTFDTIL
ncbi:hypothetical protein GN956_G20556, partial [Arapaima gigas]